MRVDALFWLLSISFFSEIALAYGIDNRDRTRNVRGHARSNAIYVPTVMLPLLMLISSGTFKYIYPVGNKWVIRGWG